MGFSGGQLQAADQWTGEQLGQIAGLVVAVDRGEHQLNGPFGGQALGFERVGKAQAADHDVRAFRSASVQLVFHMLPLGQ